MLLNENKYFFKKSYAGLNLSFFGKCWSIFSGINQYVNVSILRVHLAAKSAKYVGDRVRLKTKFR